jgi:hypothetical protein
MLERRKVSVDVIFRYSKAIKTPQPSNSSDLIVSATRMMWMISYAGCLVPYRCCGNSGHKYFNTVYYNARKSIMPSFSTKILFIHEGLVDE